MNSAKGKQPDYQSYLARMWRAPTDGDQKWRASLEETQTQEVQGFKDLQSLFTYLLAQTGQQDQQSATVIGEKHISNYERHVETN